MSVALKTMKCPDCNSNIYVEEGRSRLFCPYCGGQIVLTNENEYVYHHIDEAGIKQAETERLIRLRELELAIKERDRKRHSLIVAFAISVLFLVAGIIMVLLEKTYPGWFCVAIGGFAVLACMVISTTDNDNSNSAIKKRTLSSNEIMISDTLANWYDEHYSTVLTVFQSAGFTNITLVPLRDLSRFNSKKDGLVNTVTIDGEENFTRDEVFSKNAKVLIMYHSMKG